MIHITKQIPIKGEYDVIVAGGGIAGVAAALSAARNGARTLLIEREYMPGGLATAGLVTLYLPLCDGMGRQVSFGVSEELLRLSVSQGAHDKYPREWLAGDMRAVRESGKRFETQFNAQLFALLAERLLLSEKVQILYGTAVTDVVLDGKTITHVIAQDRFESLAYAAGAVVDATGDAAVCALAGERTREFQQGNMLAAWYCDTGAGGYRLNLLGACDIPDEYKNDQPPAGYPPWMEKRFSGLSGEELSEMVCMSHAVMLENICEQRKADPAHMPATLPTIPQIRMTRCLAGHAVLDDKASHTFQRSSIGMIGDWRKRGPVYELPFEILYGDTVDNLITAGRCVSVTDSMWDITRVIPACAVTGEAAGCAAAMTRSFSGLDIALLQSRLMHGGAVLHEK